MELRTDRKITLAVGVAALLVVATAIVGVVSTRRLVRDAAWVSHTHDVRAQLREISSHVDAAKADIRGFLLTGDTAYLTRHLESVAETEEGFIRARGLVVDNPRQVARLAALRDVLTEREIAFDRTLALARTGQLPRAELAQRLDIGERLASRVDTLIAAADREEARNLATRLREQGRSERLVAAASGALVLTAMLLVVVLGRSIRRDLTGRARAEAELRASEAKFAGILGIAADAIVTVDERQLIVHFNHGAQEIFGYAPEEAIGQPLELLLPAHHERTHRAQVERFAAGPETARRMGERGQVFGRRRNGEEFPAEASISKLRTPTGWLFTAVLRDVTERRRLERSQLALAAASGILAESLDYDETLAVIAALPVRALGEWAVLDVEEEQEGGEPVLRRLASPHPDPAIDAALREWAAIGLDADAPDVVIDVLRRRMPLRLAEVTDDWLEAHVLERRQAAIARAMGMRSLLVVPLLLRERVVGAWTIGASPGHVFDEHDEALAVALAQRAALALENARLFRRAQRATAARDQVLSVVSHDLRNPLSAVGMLAHRLAHDAPADAERRAIGVNIGAAVDWMHRLMQDLLDAASIEAGGLSVELAPQSVPAMVSTAREQFAERAASERLTLRTELPADLPLVEADASRIVQVLGNLVGNALKFTRAGGTVTIAARREGSAVLLQVRDSGVGIPPAELPHVFDRYWHARREGATGGTGLGLAIARGIVERHGGRIWVESAPGAGSTFTFTLPVAAMPRTAEPALDAGVGRAG